MMIKIQMLTSLTQKNPIIINNPIDITLPPSPNDPKQSPNINPFLEQPLIIIPDQFISSQQHKNQQLHHENNSNQQMQKMFHMLQKIVTDPTLFMKIMNNGKYNQLSTDNRKRQFQIQQHKYRNQEISPKHKDNEQGYIPNKQQRKKGTDVIKGTLTQENDNLLQKYCPVNKNISENNSNLNNFSSNSIQDRPIKSTYTSKQQQLQPNPQQLPSIPNQKYIEDDRPITPAKAYIYQSIDQNQSQLINNSTSLQPDHLTNNIQLEDRPIKGITCDFKDYIMTQQGLPLSQQLSQPNTPNNQKYKSSPTKPQKTKTFLKRGTRQFLSSAKDRSAPKQNLPNNTKNTPKQNLNISINHIKDNQKSQKQSRSISQNRILGRKNISNKSISKKYMKEEDDSKYQKKNGLYSNHNIINHNGSQRDDLQSIKQIPKNNKIKRQVQMSPKFRQSSHSPNQKPQKNIFEQSSSSNQDEPQTTPNSNHHPKYQNQPPQPQQKIQVLPGIHLTKKQLHQILTKYGRNPTQNTNNNDLIKIQQLKNKYLDLCNILTEQKKQFILTFNKQKQQFQIYKQNQLNKIKNQKKIIQRNINNYQKNKDKDKQKQDIEIIKKNIEKQRQQFKHKQKNYKIIIDKYKKIAQDKEKLINCYQQTKSGSSLEYGTTANNNNAIKKKQKMNKKLQELCQQDACTHTDKDGQDNTEYKHNKKDSNTNNTNSGFKQTTKQLTKQTTKQNTHDRDKLPNYNDLRKSNPPKQPPQDNPNRNKKYDYLEQFDSKQTVKDTNRYQKYDDDYNQPQLHSDKQQQSDIQQIVQYNTSMKLSDLSKLPLNIKMVTDEMISNLFRYTTNIQYLKYLSLTKSKSRTKVHTNRNTTQRKITNTYSDGSKQIIFDTGVKKQYFPNGYIIIFFGNGDIKQKLTDNTIMYFYHQKQVDQITLPNGINIYRFNTNQVQFHFSEKQIQIRHPDGTFKIM